MNEIQLIPSYWANVSGGKDSLYMLNLILENPDIYPLDGVVHFELEIDYPFIKTVVDFMARKCAERGVKFVRIKPRRTWNELYEKYGFPTRKARWCNGLYKLDAAKQLDEFMKSQGAYVVSYIGYCADETRRMNKRSGKTEIYPLADFGIEEHTILEWARNVPEFNNYYKTNRRCGCMYCPLSSMMEFAYLAKYYPYYFGDMINSMRATEIARERETGKPFSVISGKNPERYNAEYLAEIIPKKWIPRLEKLESEVL